MASPLWRVRGICDVSAEARSIALDMAPGVLVTSREDEIFADPGIDAVALFALADSRPEQIRKGLAAGKHLLLEKPAAETLQAEMVLSAVGVKNNLEGLGLEELGVTVERDKVKVDGWGSTGVDGIWAIGDLTHTPALAHVASSEAIACVEKICGLDPSPVDFTTIPSCVYTTPEVASVGLTEKQALDAGMEVRVGKYGVGQGYLGRRPRRVCETRLRPLDG